MHAKFGPLGAEPVNTTSASLITLGEVPPPLIAINGTLSVGGGSGANTVSLHKERWLPDTC